MPVNYTPEGEAYYQSGLVYSNGSVGIDRVTIRSLTSCKPHLRSAIEVPNWKPLRPVLLPSYEHVNRFLLKCTPLKVDLLQDHQLYCLEACMCALFSPELLQDVAVKGLTSCKPHRVIVSGQRFYAELTYREHRRPAPPCR